MSKPSAIALLQASGYTDITTELLHEARDVLYQIVGGSLDWRNWDTIMQADDPLQAAREALVPMYQSNIYKIANINYLTSKGYTAAQAEWSVRKAFIELDMEDEYTPDWADGTIWENYAGVDFEQAFEDAKGVPKSTKDIGSDPNTSKLSIDIDGDSATADAVENYALTIGDRIDGLTQQSNFNPNSSTLSVPNTFNGYGDDRVHNSQFEAFTGIYDGTTFLVTGLGAGPLTASSHTMILYDNDDTNSANFVEGLVFDGVYAEQGWGVSGDPLSRILSFNPTSSSTIYGTSGADTLTGTGNANILTGGAGVDSLTGDAGDDLFAFAAGDSNAVVGGGNDSSGQDTIQDFAAGDLIQITATLSDGFDATTDIVVGTGAGGDAGGTDNVVDFATSAYLVDVNGAGLGEGDEIVVNVTTDGASAAFANDAAAQAATVFNAKLDDAGASVVLGDNNDTIFGGAGVDTIDAGAGSDIIVITDSNASQDTVVISSAGDTAAATVLDVAGAATLDNTDTVVGNFDVVMGFQHGEDKLNILAVNNLSTGAGDSVADLAANAYEIARGSWDEGTNTFTVNTTSGTDQVVIFDDGANDVAVVLLGITDFDATDFVTV